MLQRKWGAATKSALVVGVSFSKSQSRPKAGSRVTVPFHPAQLRNKEMANRQVLVERTISLHMNWGWEFAPFQNLAKLNEE